MSIIVSKNGKSAVRVDVSHFDSEDYLQQYIYENPDSIPLYEIKEDIRLLILSREFPTSSGPIDAVGVDKDGEIYLVETKLYKNPDKRTVVAQVLDYGASLWRSSLDFNEFIGRIDNSVRKQFNLSLHQKLEQFFSLSEEELPSMLARMQSNLNSGNFKFVVLMDKLHAQLKDLIIFINENSRFTVYAVELEYYKHKEFEILIPKLFGNEVKKDITVSSAGSVRNKWNESSLIEVAQQKLSPDDFGRFMKIYDFAKENAAAINYGTGAYPSFSPIFSTVSDRSLFTLALDVKTRLSFNFEWAFEENDPKAELFAERLTKAGFKLPSNYKEIRPSVVIDEWRDKMDRFIDIIKELI